MPVTELSFVSTVDILFEIFHVKSESGADDLNRRSFHVTADMPASQQGPHPSVVKSEYGRMIVLFQY